MVINLGTTADVRRITGISSNELSDADVVKFLEEADIKIRARHYQKYMLDLFYVVAQTSNGQTSLVYELYFNQKSGTNPVVYVNGALQTLTTDYTFNGNVITFTGHANLCVGDRINIFYTPEFFDMYANYLAADRIYSLSILDANNTIMLQNRQSTKEQVVEFEKMISRKPHVAMAVDHFEDYNIW
jgi:hypothetical protein